MAVLLSRFASSAHPVTGRTRFVPQIESDVPDWSLIDLRGDCTVVDGLTLVGTSGDVGGAALRRAGGVKLGDTLDDTVGPALRTRIGNLLGVTVSDLTVRQLLRTLLLAEGREDGTRWRALRADRTGKVAIHLGRAGSDELTVPRGGATSDPFTYSNGALATVSSGAWVSDAGTMNVASNHAECGAGNGARARYATNWGTADNDSQYVVQFRGGTNHTGVFVAICRLAGATYTAYGHVRYLDAGGGGGYVSKYVSGSETQLSSDHGTGPTPDATDTLFVSAAGSSITGKRDGSHVTGSPVTDSSITTGNYVGFEIYDGFVNPDEETFVDDFTTTLGGVTDVELVVADLTVGLAIDAVALTQQNTLAGVGDLTHGLTIDGGLALVQQNTLTVDGLAVALGLDGVALTQANTLSGVADLSHTLAVDSVVLVQQNTLAGVGDLTHALGVDAVELEFGVELTVADLALGLTLDSVALVQQNTLTVADLGHAVTLDAVELDQSSILTVADLAHGLTVDGVALTQAHTLSGVADLAHGVTLEGGLALVQQHTLSGVADLAHSLTVAAVVITPAYVLVVADLGHALGLDGVTLTQANTLTVADLTVALGLDTVLLGLGNEADFVLGLPLIAWRVGDPDVPWHVGPPFVAWHTGDPRT